MSDKFTVLLDSLKAERQALIDKAAPFQKERDQLSAKIQDDEEKIRELGKTVQGILRPNLAKLERQIHALSKVIQKETKVEAEKAEPAKE